MHETENYITLTDAAKMAPSRPSANCIWRWCRKGVLARGGERIRMQHVRIGGKLFTKAQWVIEFGQALAAADASYFNLVKPAIQVPAKPHTTKQRQASIDRARRELQEAGVL